MAWRRPGDKPLSEPMMVSLSTHICVARPQWVNTLSPRQNAHYFADGTYFQIHFRQFGIPFSNKKLSQYVSWSLMWSGAYAPSHLLNQWWFCSLTHIGVTWPSYDKSDRPLLIIGRTGLWNDLSCYKLGVMSTRPYCLSTEPSYEWVCEYESMSCKI